MHRVAAVFVIMALGLVAASPAQAQIGPNVPEPLTQPPPAPPPAPVNFNDDEGLSTLQQLLVFGAAALVLGGIAFVIVRDARRAAPTNEHSRGSKAAGAGAGAAGSVKSARERQRQQRAKRSKAKAARRQRKRNRPR